MLIRSEMLHSFFVRYIKFHWNGTDNSEQWNKQIFMPRDTCFVRMRIAPSWSVRSELAPVCISILLMIVIMVLYLLKPNDTMRIR